LYYFTVIVTASTAPAHTDATLEFVADAVEITVDRLAGVDRQSMEMVLLLHRVTNAVVYDLESTVHRPAGWSWSAFRAVFTLWASGPLEPSRLADLSGMSRQAVSALVKTLEADGVVRRSAAEHDARSVVLTLTPEGSVRLERSFRAHNRREQQWASLLEPDERVTLTRLLVKLAANDWCQTRSISRRDPAKCDPESKEPT
jgi:DNA-binding MarR family transcriptional regulator